MNKIFKKILLWLGGLIAAAIVLRYLEPLLDIIESIVVNIALKTSEAYSLGFYKAIAENSPNSDHIFLGIMALLVSSIPLIIELDERHKLYITGTSLSTFGITIIYIFITLIFLLYFKNSSIRKEIIIIRNDLTKIAPYVDDIEIKKLQSQWVQIKNKNDFDSLKRNIDSLMKQKIPK